MDIVPVSLSPKDTQKLSAPYNAVRDVHPTGQESNTTKTPAWGCKVQDFRCVTNVSMTHCDI